MAEHKRADPPGTWTRSRDVSMTRAQTRASLIAATMLALAGLYTLHEFLPSLIWALVFAIGVWPLFEKAAKRWPKSKRTVLPLIVVLAVLVVFVVPVTLVAVPLAEDAHGVAAWVEQARQAGIAPPALLGKLPYGDKLTALWVANIGQPGQISAFAARSFQGGLIQTGRKFASEALHRLVLLGFMLLTLFMLLRQADAVVEQFRVASRRAFGPAGEDVGRQIVLSVHGTVSGLVLVGLAEGAILGVTYFLVGVPHATLFGLLTALLAMIPFGASVAFGVAAIVLLAVNKVVAAVIVVVIGSAATFVADHFFRPVLIGGATRLPFIWVLLGILGGVTAWGLIGLFVGPAVLAALILLWREWVGSQEGPINPQSVDKA
jgi:predicted PurR-regulated permease PerM